MKRVLTLFRGTKFTEDMQDKKQGPKKDLPNKPEKHIPVKPDINPDPTKQPPPTKTDPTRIEEPGKVDPTRIDEPNPNSNPQKQK